MNKKSVIMIVAVLLCIFVLQGAFAYDANEYRQLEVKENYTLEEALWFRPMTYSVDVLQFLQAYLNPDNPKEFFMEATGYSDDEIDEIYTIFQSFFEIPEYYGLPYWILCDFDAYFESIGESITAINDPNASYALDVLFEGAEGIAAIFPRGIGRTNAYDTFRRCALHLAVYADRNGETPGFKVCYDYIQEIFSYYDQLFNDAMAAEEAANTETITEGN